MGTEGFAVLPATWETHGDDIRRLRQEVFVSEQAVPEDEEWDADDPVSRYVIAVDGSGCVLGTGRLAPDGKIGRMAVLREQRRRGIGTALLQALLAMARAEGFHTVYLHAQSQALAFYAREGFIARGPEFNEAGITHRKMVLTLSRKPG